MNKYTFRRWLIIWITIILAGIAGVRIGYTYGHNAGVDKGVKKFN